MSRLPAALQLAPTGTLRIGIWTVPFFARDSGGTLIGLVPDLGNEMARQLGVPATLSGYASPVGLTNAFREGLLDVTFVGITADRAAVVDFGPVAFDIQTTYLVPGNSALASIGEVDRAGIRIAVPAPSAQEAHLRKIVRHAALVPVPPEQPEAALELLTSGEADAFSHVAPMLAAAQSGLPGSRILPGSYFNVPVAIGVAKGRSGDALAWARAFVEDVKASGFVQKAIARAGVQGIIVSA